MRIVVAIASLGRAATLARTVDHLADQTRAADEIILSVTSPEDIAGLHAIRPAFRVIEGPRGSCRQRNAVLDAVGPEVGAILFLDDDFVPADDYLEQVERLLLADPALVGLTGDLVADGIHGEPIAFDDARARLRRGVRPNTQFRPREALYGCNMAIRLSAADGLRFDENLPLYGWQEDIDFTYRLGQRGKLASGPMLTGIHMGVRGARQPGRRLGYSQVANIIYLQRKGTMQPGLGRKLLVNNILANTIRSLWPETGIDRRGRLAGNAIALHDWVRGRVHPMRVLELK
jgi:GT2 family glycosyltransferase